MAKVYVSSTIADLKLERRAVMEWLVAARHQPVHSYRPNSETVRNSCLEDVDTCDLYVLILGHRYGFQPEAANPEKLSITHLEFRRAGQSGVPRIALLRTSIPDTKLSDLEDPQRAPLVLAFREEVRREVRAAEFGDPQALVLGLSTGVQSELEKLSAPSEHYCTEVWLTAHFQNVARQFASHMAASVLKSGTRPEELYLDLVVAERHPGKEEKASSEIENIAKESCPLQEILAKAAAPFLLVGEGGSGKTTSLLYTAARAAERAKADQTAPIPIYVSLAGLTKLDDVPDLLQLIADSVPLVNDWNELSNLGIAEHRQMIFMFDSFNEMPEHLQRNGAVILKRFADKQKDRHLCLIGSRLVPHIEQLARPPSQFKTFEILRLTSNQVRGFLQNLGLGSLYERMPKELRELAGNPFMLLAIARTLAGAPGNTLPRNQGELYQLFVRGWMDNEEKKLMRDPEYSYERVKEPLLAYLAKRMTSAGQTSLVLTSTQEEEVKRRLEAIYQRIEHLGGMPDNWKVDRCLAEIRGDGLLKRVNEQMHFMHQSVQEYFTGYYFSHNFPDALVDFTPKLLWEFVPTYKLAELPNHRLVPPLLMMVGLLDDSTKIVEALAARNPVLAAAAVSSASRVNPALLAKLEQAWLNLLKHDDERHRMVGCFCLATASMTNRRVIQRLVEVALESNYSTSNAAALALQRLDAPEVASQVLIELVLHWTDDKYDKQERTIAELLGKLQTRHTVNALFERWRASPFTSPDLTRIEGLLATVDESLRAEELQRIRSETSDPAVAADVEKALAEGSLWKKLSRGLFTSSLLKRIISEQMWWEIDRAYQAATELHNVEDQELAAALHASDPAVRNAGARMAAERGVPVGDIILETLLRIDHGWDELVSTLVSLWGESTSVSKLIALSREGQRFLGAFTPELGLGLDIGELPEALKAELDGLGVNVRHLSVVEKKTEDGTSIWLLSSAEEPFNPRYQIRASRGRLEVYDCNSALRAIAALEEIPGEVALAELQRAFEHDGPNARRVAMLALARRGDQSLAEKLVTLLSTEMDRNLVSGAIIALGTLRAHQAVSLVQHLLMINETKFGDEHPVWGPNYSSRGWAESIHQTLSKLEVDAEIQHRLDEALDSENPTVRGNAAKEFGRWFREAHLGVERKANWTSPERRERLLNLALSDPSEDVRSLAAQVVGELESNVVQDRLQQELGNPDQAIRAAAAHALRFIQQEGTALALAVGLSDSAFDVRLSAAESLVRLEAREMDGRVTETMLPIARSNRAPDIRRRAGRVLSAILGGLEPLYQPIQEELGHGGSERALELIEAALEIIPEDVNLFWWRGHALRSLGRLDRAADNYQRAFELEKRASVIPQALAQTFLELGDFPRAMETARRGVEIAPADAEAQSILAWSSYKAGAIPEAVEAASKAVDLDPVHGDAIWIVLLGHVRQANLEESRSAFQHAMRVRQLLSPGLDTSFVTSFVKELEGINTDSAEISRLMDDIKEALRSKDEAGPN